MLKKTEKVARGISGRKLHFQGEFSSNVLFVCKTLKSKVYVLQKASNLFGPHWIVLFNLWELPINSFCNKINVSSPFKKPGYRKYDKKSENKISTSIFRRSGYLQKDGGKI